MATQMTKGKKLLFLAALMMTNFAVMGDNLLYPITANIYGEYYENMALTNYVVSGPLLVIFVVSLLAPALLKKINQKTMLLIGGTLFGLSAFFGVSVDSIVYMAVMRTFTGIGQAFINVAAMSLIAQVYVDEQECGAVMGSYNSCMPIVGILYSLISGTLAVQGWRNAYYGYLVALPMVIMIALFIPSLPRQSPSQPDAIQAEAKPRKKGMPMVFWVAAAAFLFIVIAFNMMAFYVSFYVAEHDLGNEAVAGVMSTMISIGSMLFCFLYGKIYEKCRVHTMTLSIVLLAVAMALLLLVPNVVVTGVSLILVGGSYGLSLTYCYAIGAETAPEGMADTAIGYVTAIYAIGGFVSTYISTWLMEVMHTDGCITPTLVVPLGLMVLSGLVFPFFARKK